MLSHTTHTYRHTKVQSKRKPKQINTNKDVNNTQQPKQPKQIQIMIIVLTTTTQQTI